MWVRIASRWGPQSEAPHWVHYSLVLQKNTKMMAHCRWQWTTKKWARYVSVILDTLSVVLGVYHTVLELTKAFFSIPWPWVKRSIGFHMGGATMNHSSVSPRLPTQPTIGHGLAGGRLSLFSSTSAQWPHYTDAVMLTYWQFTSASRNPASFTGTPVRQRVNNEPTENSRPRHCHKVWGVVGQVRSMQDCPTLRIWKRCKIFIETLGFGGFLFPTWQSAPSPG